MLIERAAQADEELVEAMARLVPQLSRTARPPGIAELMEMAAAPGTSILLARDDGGRIVGTLTLVVHRLPSGTKAVVEDVVVEEPARGQGAGQALLREALRRAELQGAVTVDLTSRPERAAANRLYRRLGFELRETNVYRRDLRRG